MKMVTQDQIRALNEANSLQQPITIVKNGLGYELTYPLLTGLLYGPELFTAGIDEGYWAFNGDSDVKEFTVIGRAKTTVCIIRGLLDQS